MLEAFETSFRNNAKIIVPSDKDIVDVIGEMAEILPIKGKGVEKQA